LQNIVKDSRLNSRWVNGLYGKPLNTRPLPGRPFNHGFFQEIQTVNKQITIAALAGLFSLGAFAQALAPVAAPAQEQAAVPADAASGVKHHHKHHKQHKHHASAATEASAAVQASAPAAKP
jgi:hypothetical protein